MTFEPTAILSQFDDLHDCHSLVVAYSGGLDSTVLLHALLALRNSGDLRQSVRAVHVNHGLHPASENWQKHCEQLCQQLGVELQGLRVTVEKKPGRSLEELAREVRYQIFSEQLRGNDCLVMAHHLDDQMENLLLRLTRGSGPAGLAGMPRRRSLGNANLLRPLLDYRRQSLLQYAQRCKLEWIEDDSNINTEFDRNFWRHEILPRIGRRFPGFRGSWRKSMLLCNEADQLQKELAAGDLSNLVTDDTRVLEVEALLKFSEPRQRNVLRYWMLELGFEPPGWQLMQRLTNEILTSNKYGARLECPAGTVQRFGEQLVLMNSHSDLGASTLEKSWNPRLDQVLRLDDNGELKITLSATAEPVSKHCRVKVTPTEFMVRYRQEGERCRLVGRPTRSLKKILQDSSLPPWLRSRQPLVYAKGQLVCIPGIGVCEDYVAEPDQPGQEIVWQPPDLLYSPV